MNNIIYLDYQATTPVDPRVTESMLPFFSHKFGNPSSRSSFHGREASAALEFNRSIIAQYFYCTTEEIIFNSGATEGLNAIIRTVIEKRFKPQSNVVISAIEHSAVYKTVKSFEKFGVEVRTASVDSNGFIDLTNLESLIDANTLLCCVIHGNNEIGTIQNLNAITIITENKKVPLLVDAVQTFGKFDFKDVINSIDYLVFTGHKIYAPKGIGGIYIKNGKNNKYIGSFNEGGGQEFGLRSGTVNIPSVVGLGTALQLFDVQDLSYMGHMSELLLKAILAISFETKINGSLEQRILGNVNVTFPGFNASDIMKGLTNFSLSTGSACSTGSFESNRIHRAIGLTDEDSKSTLRFGVGRFSKPEEISLFSEHLLNVLTKLNR